MKNGVGELTRLNFKTYWQARVLNRHINQGREHREENTHIHVCINSFV